MDDKSTCRWCLSQIQLDAKYCKECGKWQSIFRDLVNPSNILAIFGALAAWVAVIVSFLPDENPMLHAVNEVEAFEEVFGSECYEAIVGDCYYEFWSRYVDSIRAIRQLDDLDARKELHARVRAIRLKNIEKYAERDIQT